MKRENFSRYSFYLKNCVVQILYKLSDGLRGLNFWRVLCSGKGKVATGKILSKCLNVVIVG